MLLKVTGGAEAEKNLMMLIWRWCQVCHVFLREQRWMTRTVRGGGWSVWMRWPPWRSSSLTWRSSKFLPRLWGMVFVQACHCRCVVMLIKPLILIKGPLYRTMVGRRFCGWVPSTTSRLFEVKVCVDTGHDVLISAGLCAFTRIQSCDMYPNTGFTVQYIASPHAWNMSNDSTCFIYSIQWIF